MKKTIYIMTDSHSDEPIVFTDRREAFGFMGDILIEHGKYYNYDEKDIEKCLNEMADELCSNEKFFEGDLGERQVCCYTQEVEFKEEER